MEQFPIFAGLHLGAVGVEGAQAAQAGQAGFAQGRVFYGGGAGLGPKHIGGGIQHHSVDLRAYFAQGGLGGQVALGGGKGVKPLGQVLGIGQQTALPAYPVVGEHRVQKIQPCAVVEQHQVKGPILGPAHIVPKADAGIGQPGAADAVFPHRPVPGPVQAFQAGGVVIAVKGAGQQAQAGVFGQGAVGLPLQMLADEPVEIRVSGQFAAQRLQQAGGHGIIAVQEQHPLAFCGGQPGVAGVSQAAVLLVEHPQAGNLRRQHVADLAAGIGRAVIHEDALPIPGTGLLRHAFDARRQVVLHIINRHDDGKLGHGVVSFSRTFWLPL